MDWETNERSMSILVGSNVKRHRELWRSSFQYFLELGDVDIEDSIEMSRRQHTAHRNFASGCDNFISLQEVLKP